MNTSIHNTLHQHDTNLWYTMIGIHGIFEKIKYMNLKNQDSTCTMQHIIMKLYDKKFHWALTTHGDR